MTAARLKHKEKTVANWIFSRLDALAHAVPGFPPSASAHNRCSAPAKVSRAPSTEQMKPSHRWRRELRTRLSNGIPIPCIHVREGRCVSQAVRRQSNHWPVLPEGDGPIEANVLRFQLDTLASLHGPLPVTAWRVQSYGLSVLRVGIGRTSERRVVLGSSTWSLLPLVLGALGPSNRVSTPRIFGVLCP